MNAIREKLIELEVALHTPEVRSSRSILDELIDDEFREIGASGAYFGKKEVLDRLPGEEKKKIEATEFEYRKLSDSIAHLTYKARFFDQTDTLIRVSYRTSIWKLKDKKWKMVFHQGTITE